MSSSARPSAKADYDVNDPYQAPGWNPNPGQRRAVAPQRSCPTIADLVVVDEVVAGGFQILCAITSPASPRIGVFGARRLGCTPSPRLGVPVVTAIACVGTMTSPSTASTILSLATSTAQRQVPSSRSNRDNSLISLAFVVVKLAALPVDDQRRPRPPWWRHPARAEQPEPAQLADHGAPGHARLGGDGAGAGTVVPYLRQPLDPRPVPWRLDGGIHAHQPSLHRPCRDAQTRVATGLGRADPPAAAAASP
jgi:hypothetical protein